MTVYFSLTYNVFTPSETLARLSISPLPLFPYASLSSSRNSVVPAGLFLSTLSICFLLHLLVIFENPGSRSLCLWFFSPGGLLVFSSLLTSYPLHVLFLYFCQSALEGVDLWH